MQLAVDILLVLVFALTVFRGWWSGFFKTVFSVGRLILSLVITVLFGSACAGWLDETFINPPVFEAVFKRLTDIAADGTSGIEGAISLKVTTTPDADLRDTIFFAMAEQRYAVISMELVEQSLESIFLTLTGENTTDKEEDD